jgi:hypothetical protein
MATPPIASATSGSAHHHPTAAFVMSQLGHTDPAFTLPVYAQAMRRDEGAKELLKALVNGVDLALTGTGSPDPSANAPEPAEPSNDETPADAEASDHGRGWFRTSDLSRVKQRGAIGARAFSPANRANRTHVAPPETSRIGPGWATFGPTNDPTVNWSLSALAGRPDTHRGHWHVLQKRRSRMRLKHR